jgi:uncharacterized membrane protein YfcA
MKSVSGQTPPLVIAALFAAMAGAFIYQGISENIPPDFLGAALLLVGVVIALRMAWRKRHA